MAIHTVDRLLARDGGEDLTAYCGASPNEDTMGAVGDRTVTEAQRVRFFTSASFALFEVFLFISLFQYPAACGGVTA